MTYDPTQDGKYLSFTDCRKIHCGLSWDPDGETAADVDLDLLYATYDEYGRMMSCVSGKDGITTDASGSIYHSGDDANGADTGDDERITLDLFSIPQSVHYIFLLVEISSDHTFGAVQNPVMRIVRAAEDQQILKLPLGVQEGLQSRANIYMRIDRRVGGWALNTIGKFIEGSSVPDWEETLIDFLPSLAGERRSKANLPPVPKKGESVPLAVTKQARHRIQCGVSWDVREGSADNQVDVDLTCIMYDANGDYVADVSSDPLRAIDESGAVYHSGDEVTGAGGGDDESISVELIRLPEHIVHVVFVIDMKTDHRLRDIRNPTIRIADGMSNQDQLFVNIDQSNNGNAYIFARLFRTAEGWMLHYIGAPLNTEELEDWSEATTPYLK